MRTFEYSDASSHKFWNVDLRGAIFLVTWGRIGTPGQTQTKSFPDEARARKEHDRLIAEKLRKGYRETTPSTRSAPASLRDSLEAALVDDPDDLANHMAYADYLTDQGDPLGDFIRTQLALEDGSKSPAERKRLQQQEKSLLKAHGAGWLGELAPYLFDKRAPGSDTTVKFTFARGWLDSLHVTGHNVTFTRVLARSPQVRLLRRLTLHDDLYEEPGDYEPGPDVPEGEDFPALFPLAHCPYLANVRVFTLGEMLTRAEEDEADDGGISCHTEGTGVLGLIKRMPKLEELYLLAHDVDAEQLFSLKTLDRLRVLMLYHNRSYPLARLAKNPSLRNLTHLLCHPHAMDDDEAYIRAPAVKALVNATTLPALTHLRLRLSDMGDKGVREIVASGILKRLKLLDLRHGCITDEGARMLAACPDLKNLEALDLTHNCLTDAGVRTLRATRVKVSAKKQWEPGEATEWGGDDEYLYAGDIE